MNQVTTLFRKMFLVSTACFVAVYFIISILSPYARNKSSYLAASLDKESMLTKIKGPRIIFVGGSNLALGLNSKLLSGKTGYSIVNMGLHAGLGLSFILNEAKSGAKPKDIIVLSIEHFLDKGDKKLIAQLIDINPKAQSLINFTWVERMQLVVFQLQRCLSSSFYKLIKRDKDPCYFREAFTKQGDLIIHFGYPKPAHVSGNIIFPIKDYSSNIKIINLFIKEVEAKGAIVYFTFPAYQASAYALNRKSLEKLAGQYQSYLKCPILGDIRTSVFEDKYFFDTVYHLDSIGIQKRTAIMFDLLQQAKQNKYYYRNPKLLSGQTH